MSFSQMHSGTFPQSKSRVCAESPIHCRCPRMSHKLHSQRIRMTFLQYQAFFLFSLSSFLQILIPLQHNQTNSTSTSKTSSQPIPPSSLPLPYSHPSIHLCLSRHSRHSKTIKSLLPTVPSSTRLDKSEPLCFPIHHSTPEIFDY